MKQTLRNPMMKALSEWFRRGRSRLRARCNYDDNYYGDRQCEKHSRA